MFNTSSSSIFTATKLILLTFLLGQNVFGQTDSDRLTRIMDSLFFQENGDKRPGYCASVIQDNEVIYQRSIGQINVEKEIPFDENSVFAIASCTKQFTAFGVLLLEQEGKLKFTDDIRKYIPELPEFGHTITIRHLLSHTSGIRDHLTLLDWANKQWTKYYTFKGTIRGLQKYPSLSFPPGENFAYSNTGYVLLAILIERVSDKTIEEFMQQEIFEPLQMNDTEFSYKRDYRNLGFSRPYNYNWDKKKFITFRRKEVNAMGAVGIYTTMNDFIKWDQNFTAMVVGDESLFERFLQSDTLNNGLSINYNNGLKEREMKGYRVVEHSGGWAYYNFQYTRIPELKLSVIIASNNELDYPIGMVEKYIKTILPKKRVQKRKATDISEQELKSGTYIGDNFTLRTLKKDENSTKIVGEHLYGAKSFQLYKLSNGIYVDSAGSKLIPNYETGGFWWSGGGYFNVPMEFHALDTVAPDLKKLAGKYENSELGTIRIIYRKKNQTIKIKTSFGKKPRIQKVQGKFIDLRSVQYDLLIEDGNTLIIGNSIVFNLVFIRK